MTYTEARDILDKRINWRDTGSYLTADNSTTDSGRYFQDEHSAVTLDNIRACQPEVGISDADFNTYLTQLRQAAILQVLADVFGSESEITDGEIELRVGLYDNAISLRVAVNVLELVINSIRSNSTEIPLKENVHKLMVDLNGHVDSKWIGLRNRYQSHIRELKTALNKQTKLKSITAGAFNNYLNPYYGKPFKG